MQDIKIRRPMQTRPQPQHQKPVTVRETEKIVREVFETPQTLAKPQSRGVGSWKKLIAAALVVILAAIVVSFVMGKLTFLTRPPVFTTDVKEQPPVVQQKPLFDPDAFYGVRLADGTLYFGRVTEAAQGHYRLVDVFYQKSEENAATSTASTTVDVGDMSDRSNKSNRSDRSTPSSDGARRSDRSNTSYTSDMPDMPNRSDRSNKITLVKFGTEEYAPQDELYIPREKVKEIFPLKETSVILKAIQEYLYQ